MTNKCHIIALFYNSSPSLYAKCKYFLYITILPLSLYPLFSSYAFSLVPSYEVKQDTCFHLQLMFRPFFFNFCIIHRECICVFIKVYVKNGSLWFSLTKLLADIFTTGKTCLSTPRIARINVRCKVFYICNKLRRGKSSVYY